MAIADRITSIEEHIKESYQELEGLGIDTTGVNNNLENIPKLIDGYWETLPKVTGEGNSITLDNTKEGKMKIELKGNTSQEGTPTPETPQDIHVVSGDNSIEVCGKNFFNASAIENANISVSNNGATIVLPTSSAGGNAVSAGATLRQLAPNLKVGETYKILINSTSSSKVYIYVGETWINNNSKTITENMLNASVYFYGESNTTTTITNMMIIKSSTTDTTYEAYKGASYPITLPDGMFLGWIPNTDYRDKIDKSSGKNLLDLNRTLGQPSDTTAVNTTKRLFNYNEVVKGISGTNYYYPQFISSYSIENQTISITTGATATYGLGFPIKIKANTTYTMSFDKSSANGRVQVSYYASDGTHINYEVKSVSFTFTTPSNCDFILINFTGIETNTTYIFTNCRLNEGTTALPYEPYGTGWYVKKEIGKVVLDENISMDYNGTAGKFYKENQNICPNYKSNTSMLSNYLLYSSTTWVKNCFGITASNIFWLYIENGPTSLADLRTWLSNHNITIYFVLNTPTYTEITDSTLISQLNALAKSYNSQTNISQENNDMPFELNVEALKTFTE